MAQDKYSEWQKLEWAKKVELCEQGRANENNLLQSYRFIFIAVEAILLAAVFNAGWNQLWGGFVALLGLALAILWGHMSELRGNAVTRWEEILASLWAKVDESEGGVSELAGHYGGAVERRRRRREGGRIAIFWGWGRHRRLLSAHWMFTTLMPLFVVCVWLWVMIVCFTRL